MVYGILHNNWNCVSQMITKSTGLVTTMNHKMLNINVCIFGSENCHDNFSGHRFQMNNLKMFMMLNHLLIISYDLDMEN